jgi:hypothetical protein
MAEGAAAEGGLVEEGGEEDTVAGAMRSARRCTNC